MFKDANPGSFAGIYVVCGYTDLRYGIDSLAAIIEKKYQKSLFVPNTLSLFCGRSASKIKGLLWEGDGFLLLYTLTSRNGSSQTTFSDLTVTQPTVFFRLRDVAIAINSISGCSAIICL